MSEVRHIGVGNASKLPNSDVAFWVEAARIQIKQVAKAWGIPAPGVAFYGEPSHLPEETAAVVEFVDDDGDDQAAGEHLQFGQRVFAMVDVHQSAVPPRTLTHELPELLVNPHLDEWVVGPGGRRYAREVCDPVQRGSYTIDVVLFGETRSVPVSDFVLPAWFGLPNPFGIDPERTAWVTPGLKPFQVAPGGYQVVLAPDGTIAHLGAEQPPGSRVRALATRLQRPLAP